ncbi:MAG: hypothetical protein H7Y22_18985 [Gemmatimonadaceae bacterium]|nr:hypothetical protein [Gloeobacterales cyanobacterium ES-bin-141]
MEHDKTQALEGTSHGHRTLSEEELANLAGVPARGHRPEGDDDLLEGFTEEPEEALAGQLPQRGELWNNPFIKAGAVGTVMLGIVCAAGVLIVGFDMTPKLPPPAVSAPTPLAVQEESDPTGTLKTEVALGKQEKDLANLKRPALPKASSVLAEKRLPARPPAPSVAPGPPPSLPQLPPQPLQATVATQQTVPLQDLAKIGSYGQVYAMRGPASVAQGGSIDGGTVAFQSAQASTTGQERRILVRDELPVLKGRVAKQLLIQTTAEGVIAKPLVAEGNVIASTGARAQQATIVMTSPLLYDDGSEAVPAGSEVVAKLESISSNGFVQMSAVSLLLRKDGRRSEIKLPEGAISVSGGRGDPLIASNLNDRGPEIASQDMGQFAAGAAQTGAALFNRATSQTTSSGIGGFAASTAYPPINLLAGIIQGGSSQMTQNLNQRAREAITRSSARPNIWSLSVDTPVQLNVNQTMDLSMDYQP